MNNKIVRFFLYILIFFTNNIIGEEIMTNEEYKKFAKKFMPNENKLKKEIIAFFIGGLMGVIAQGLIDIYIKLFNISYDDSVCFMMITLIFFACLFTAMGFFDELVKKAGAGLFVPITGFAHSMTSSAIEYKKEGLVFGIGSNIFKLAGSVILYGTVSAFTFGLIRFIFFGG